VDIIAGPTNEKQSSEKKEKNRLKTNESHQNSLENTLKIVSASIIQN
jgi:hypothetical protein